MRLMLGQSTSIGRVFFGAEAYVLLPRLFGCGQSDPFGRVEILNHCITALEVYQ